MNKGNLNKLVTNYPVSLTNEEVENLSLTLSAVRTAGGGGGEGKTYHGEGFVSVNNTNNTISLTTEADEKLNQPIPTKVSDLTDSANYQTTAGMASYETTQHASQTYLTKSSADNDYAPLSTTADVDALKAVSGDFSLYYNKTETSSKEALSDEFAKYVTITDFNGVTGDVSTLKSASSEWNKVSDKLDTTAFSTVSGTFLTEVPDTYATKEYANDASANAFNQATALIPDVSNFITKDVNDLTNYYNKTQTSSDSELSTEFAKYATTTYVDGKDPVLIGDSNITATSSTIDGHTQWNLAINATPVVTNTKLVGDNCVTAHTTQTSGEWIVGLEQTAYEAIDSVSGIANDVATLKNASASWNEVSAKLGTAQYANDSATFVTSSISTITGTKQYALTTAGWAEVSTPTIPDITATSGISANGFSIGLTNTAIGAITSVSSKVDIPDTTQTVLNNNYLIYSTLTDPTATTGWMPLSANYYSKTEADGRYVTTANVGAGLYYSGSSPKLGIKLGTDLAFDSNGFVQVNVGGNNIVDSAHYAFIVGVDHTASGQGAFAGGYGTHTSGVGNFIHGTYLNFNSGPNYDAVSNTPVFVGGTLNATTAQDYTDHGGYLQIMGNGTYTGGGHGNNSDAYILYRDGTVKAKDFIAGGDTLSANYPVPKSVPNTADNNLQVQKMFVCTSDNDIVAHAALANGEGCIFFRVG